MKKEEKLRKILKITLLSFLQILDLNFNCFLSFIIKRQLSAFEDLSLLLLKQWNKYKVFYFKTSNLKYLDFFTK